MLDGYSPIFTLVATALALIANLICMRWLRIEERQVLDQSRYPTIDGLRGFLAFFVFLHHAAYWLLYSGSGEWIKPRTKFYTNLGPLGVSLFFMITAFLFIGKILDEPCNTRESWYRTYRSRIYRIVPLYFVAIGLLLLLVGIQTRWIIAEPLGRLMRNVASWIFFNFGGQPDINGLAGTPLIISGVTWTLMYEWAFYLLLPVFAAMLGKKPPVEIFLASLASGIAFLKFKAFLRRHRCRVFCSTAEVQAICPDIRRGRCGVAMSWMFIDAIALLFIADIIAFYGVLSNGRRSIDFRSIESNKH